MFTRNFNYMFKRENQFKHNVVWVCVCVDFHHHHHHHRTTCEKIECKLQRHSGHSAVRSYFHTVSQELILWILSVVLFCFVYFLYCDYWCSSSSLHHIIITLLSALLTLHWVFIGDSLLLFYVRLVCTDHLPHHVSHWTRLK